MPHARCVPHIASGSVSSVGSPLTASFELPADGRCRGGLRRRLASCLTRPAHCREHGVVSISLSLAAASLSFAKPPPSGGHEQILCSREIAGAPAGGRWSGTPIAFVARHDDLPIAPAAVRTRDASHGGVRARGAGDERREPGARWGRGRRDAIVRGPSVPAGPPLRGDPEDLDAFIAGVPDPADQCRSLRPDIELLVRAGRQSRAALSISADRCGPGEHRAGSPGGHVARRLGRRGLLCSGWRRHPVRGAAIRPVTDRGCTAVDFRWDFQA